MMMQVIVTGSQIPAFETRSDGRDNLVGALIMAANCHDDDDDDDEE